MQEHTRHDNATFIVGKSDRTLSTKIIVSFTESLRKSKGALISGEVKICCIIIIQIQEDSGGPLPQMARRMVSRGKNYSDFSTWGSRIQKRRRCVAVSIAVASGQWDIQAYTSGGDRRTLQ